MAVEPASELSLAAAALPAGAMAVSWLSADGLLYSLTLQLLAGALRL